METAVHWFRENGFVWSEDDVDIRKDDYGGWGVFAVRDIPEDTVVVRIPVDCVLSTRSTAIANLLEEDGLAGTAAGLVLSLMYERSMGNQSPWFGYIASLPNFVDLPVLWELDMIESRLKGTELYSFVIKDKVGYFRKCCDGFNV